MIIRKSNTLKQILDRWPGKRTFGIYRFLPIFFGLGAALEFSMIHWRVGETNFYNTFKKRQAKEIVEEKLRLHQLEPISPK
ncbi:small integral membrane protein 4 [Anopheles funestus]|uniref:small integral membrane protein 4 n=1 Tax=Anopheles funestus TaxID=62324 RepID=UPI0020C67B96|nr:small integral membrane protein 4 [Anopheles funestus]